MPLEAVVFGILLVLGIAGVWLVPDATFKRLVVMVLVVFVTIYVVGNAASRFRVPLLPLLMLYVGPLLTGTIDGARWRSIGAGVSIAAWLAIAAVDVFARPRMEYAALVPAPRASAWSPPPRDAAA